MRRVFPILFALLPAPLQAQDLAFDIGATEACLAAADSDAARFDCAGTSAAACARSPDGGTTVGTGFCYGREADYWDARLNAAFAALRSAERAMMDEMAAIGARVPDTVDALRDMQRAWIGYRDASCAYEYATWGGGTGGGPATSACLMRETARQTLKLETRMRERFE